VDQTSQITTQLFHIRKYCLFETIDNTITSFIGNTNLDPGPLYFVEVQEDAFINLNVV